MRFDNLVQACKALETANPNMTLGEIRQFVLACMALGATTLGQRLLNDLLAAQTQPVISIDVALPGPGSDVSGVPIERGDG